MSAASTQADSRNVRILAVDDEPFNLDLIKRAFRRDYEVTTYEDARAALESLRDTEYDLLVTDVKMPVMDGLELARAARRVRPALSVVVLSAYTDAQEVIRAHDEGTVDVVVDKPWDAEVLKDQLRRALLLSDMRRRTSQFPVPE